MNLSDPEFNALYNQHRHGVITRAYQILRNREDAEEVANDVFIKFRQHQHKVKEEKLAAWLMTSTKNKCIDVIRKRNQKPGHEQDIEIHTIRDPRTHIEKGVINKEVIEIIEEALQKIGETETTRAYRLRVIEGYDDKEVAEIIGCHHNTIRVKVHRCKKRLKKLIENRYRE